MSELTQLSLSLKTVTVKWTQSDAKAGYSYRVDVSYPNGTQIKQLDVSDTRASVGGLQSGGRYNVTVTTQTAGGTHAPAKSITALTSKFWSLSSITICMSDGISESKFQTLD